MARDAIGWAVILRACGVASAQVDQFAPHFAAYCTPGAFNLGEKEIPGFLGQVLHESNMLKTMEENLRYSAARIRELGNQSAPGTRWRSLVPRADELANNPQALANAAYGGRNGNTGPNDGWLYRGRGLIQITGKSNYLAMENATGLKLIANPDMVLEPVNALRVSIAWWEKFLSDAAIGDTERETRGVNGGTTGLAHRTKITILARSALAEVKA